MSHIITIVIIMITGLYNIEKNIEGSRTNDII